ncbi:MAG: hypothetical protein HYS13_00840 [Planctomycetia bacterium]|nr:hypothetical protein [Planctomycetia bacterium]
MPPKPTTAAGYGPDQVELVRATALYVATKIGDLLDEVTVVGGFVPSLLLPPEGAGSPRERHVGTMDLDVGPSLGILDARRYQELAERLRRADFAPDVNENNRPTRQRWRFERGADVAATVDFLIDAVAGHEQPGRLFDLEKELAAIVTPGLRLAFADREKVQLQGRTILGEQATRDVWVCGPGAYVVLKALAFENRGENKDAYDLFYVVKNYGQGTANVADRLRTLLGESECARAITILERDFSQHDAVGPRRVAEFLAGRPDDEIQADVVGFITGLLALCRT